MEGMPAVALRVPDTGAASRASPGLRSGPAEARRLPTGAVGQTWASRAGGAGGSGCRGEPSQSANISIKFSFCTNRRQSSKMQGRPGAARRHCLRLASAVDRRGHGQWDRAVTGLLCGGRAQQWPHCSGREGRGANGWCPHGAARSDPLMTSAVKKRGAVPGRSCESPLAHSPRVAMTTARGIRGW